MVGGGGRRQMRGAVEVRWRREARVRSEMEEGMSRVRSRVPTGRHAHL
jgi:hypothetical protein